VFISFEFFSQEINIIIAVNKITKCLNFISLLVIILVSKIRFEFNYCKFSLTIITNFREMLDNERQRFACMNSGGIVTQSISRTVNTGKGVLLKIKRITAIVYTRCWLQ
jgi:hypothetical protein